MSDKVLYENKWVSLMETPDGYVYSHETRCKGHTVSVMVVNSKAEKILGRFEMTPAHGPQTKLCSITGGVEHDDPVSTALHELEEEAGIVVTADKLISLGTVWQSKSADTVVHLFCIEYDGPINRNPAGDGSAGEVGSTVEWVSVDDAIACGDPLMAAAWGRFWVKFVLGPRVDQGVLQ